ncbi:MAG: tetratricopeptide repeat protein [Candidatus Eisenbacteria bacterium]
MERALAFHSAGRLEEADRIYASLEERGAASADVFHLRGVLAYQQGSLEVARSRIERAIAVDGTDPSYHSNLGIVQKALGDLDGAVRSFRAALDIAPEFLDAKNNLGTVMKAQGRLEEAAAEFRGVIALRPDVASAHNNLGVVERSLGNLDSAESAYLRATELEPRYADAHHNLGNLRLQREQFADAAKSFETALAVGEESAETLRCLALALEGAGRVEEAITRCGRACAFAPDHARLRDQLGTLQQRLGNLDDAKSAYEHALTLSPGDSIASFHLATVLQEQGDTEGALRLYRAVLAADPTLAPAHRALGKLLYGLGDVEGAMAAYRAWADLDPTDPEARYLVAACSQDDAPDRSPAEFVRSHYDQFARDFDRQLARLGYCGPDLVAQILAGHLTDSGQTWDVLDAGCGTGLSGVPLRSLADRLVGVDLSEGMLEHARARGIYDELVSADLIAYLGGHPSAFDLVVAADTLIYFGALSEFFGGVARTLRPGGLFVFTAEAAGAAGATDADAASANATDPAPGYLLSPSGRFAHAKQYLLETLAGAGLETLDVRRAVLRTEVSRGVQAWVVLARRTSYREVSPPEDLHGSAPESRP